MADHDEAPGDERHRIVIAGRSVDVAPGRTVLQVWLDVTDGPPSAVGCAGQAVCGACRALVRLPGSNEVTTVLACERLTTDGMHVSFLDHVDPRNTHHYDLAALATDTDIADEVHRAFPEAAHCRHCGGCDAACPVDLPVEAAVADAVTGRLTLSAAAFDTCVMCSLCTAACPEEIAPNHLGVFLRRALAATAGHPDDLTARLAQIADGSMSIDLHAPASLAPEAGDR